MPVSFISNIFNGALKKIKKITNNPYSKLGISWLTIKKLKHQGYNNSGSINIQGNTICYLHPPEVIASLNELFIHDIYKIKLSTNNPFIIDCGANIGFSILKLKLQYPNSKILAFEPDEKNFELLKKNTQQFSDIQLENKAVWHKNEILKFCMSGTQSSNYFDNEKANHKLIDAVKLKTYLNTKIDFLKIDIEGAEYEVIKDCEEKLVNVDNLFVEYHGSFKEQFKLVELITILNKASFKIYIKEADNVYPTPFYIEKNKLFDQQLNIFAFK